MSMKHIPELRKAKGKLRIPAPIAQLPRLNTLAHADALFSTPTAIPPMASSKRVELPEPISFTSFNVLAIGQIDQLRCYLCESRSIVESIQK